MSAKTILSNSTNRYDETDENHCRSSEGWIGVDLDGTLAQYTRGADLNEIGEPIEPMMERVRKWLAQGRLVKIFTARAAIPRQVEIIKAWLAENGLPDLEITNTKDFGMIELWDDRCIQVNANTGLTAFETPRSRSHMRVKVKVSKRRTRGGMRPVAKLLLAIERFATSWNQVPSHEFQPTAWGPRVPKEAQ